MNAGKVLLATSLLLTLLAAAAFSQGTTVTGKVTDQSSNPLVGANVGEKGTKRGTATDLEGHYSLAVSSPKAIIIFSHVGHKRREMKLDGRTSLDVVLQESGVELGEMTVVGTRSAKRSATETPVAVDVLEIKDIANREGRLDVNQLLQYIAPSFNTNRQSGADGADHIDPATLRGLGPDQTLVLINGKRRHASSLINLFGSRGRGNTGTDLDAIPVSAIERIEVLRDGASAQYGSDAIAGVINIVLKSNVDEFAGSVSTGAHAAKLRTDRSFDGEEVALGGNYGIRVGDDGYLNMTAEYLRKGSTNRPADPNLYNIYRRQFGDAALENFGSFFNARIPSGDLANFYAFGGFNYRTTDAYAWTRDPGSDRNVPSIYPNGFDPHILSTITDPSISLGLRTRTGSWDLDLNNTYGVNRFHYYVDGTVNASMLDNSPTRFDAGGFQLMQNTTSMNFTRAFDAVLQGLNVALGMEYRIENYQIFAGEDASWKNYGVIDTVINNKVTAFDALGRPGGAQGFPGFRPENALDEFRSNLGAYADVELDVTDQWLIAAAARYETYSDFGNTLNGKIATRFRVNDALALRASASTGFRAPSLAQIYFNSTFTDVAGGKIIDKLIAKNNSPITRRLGIPALKQETATNAAVGFTLTPLKGLTATVDGYYVKINDRIVLTGAFDQSDPDIGADLVALNVGAAQFFTNALDTKTLGVDAILTYAMNFDAHQLRLSYAGNFNRMTLGAVKTSPKLAGKQDTYFGDREQHFLIASAPPAKNSLTVDYGYEQFHANLRFTHFGRVSLIDWLGTEDVYTAKVTTDFSLAYDLTNNLTLVAGAANVFDVYPTQQEDTETETGGLWDAVQMGFSGRFYFARLNVRM
jgi:iron complex outermembrane receptor protein